jgi:hypothetical protein
VRGNRGVALTTDAHFVAYLSEAVPIALGAVALSASRNRDGAAPEKGEGLTRIERAAETASMHKAKWR